MTTPDGTTRRLRVLAITGWLAAVVAAGGAFALRQTPASSTPDAGMPAAPTPTKMPGARALEILDPGPNPCAVPRRPITTLTELKWYLESDAGTAMLRFRGFEDMRATRFIVNLREVPLPEAAGRCRWETTVDEQQWRVCFVDSVDLRMIVPDKPADRIPSPTPAAATPSR